MRQLCLLPLLVVLVGCDDADPLEVRPSPIATHVALTASAPAVLLRSGGTVTVRATVTDPNGTRVANTPVEFSADTGSLSAQLVTTDALGVAAVVLSGHEATTVRASAAGQNASMTIGAVNPFTLAVVSESTPVTLNQPAAMRVTVTPATGVINPPMPQSLSLTCADRTAPMSGGVGYCTFGSTGTALVTVTGTTADGWATTGQTSVQVVAARTTEPPAATVSLSTVQVSGTEWGIRATASVPMRSIGFIFGDGASASRVFDAAGGTFAAESHIYPAAVGTAKTYTVQVIGTPLDGRPAVTQTTTITITPP
jgi:hypothetical protein